MARTYTNVPEPRYVEKAKHAEHVAGLEGLGLDAIRNFEELVKVIPTEIIIQNGKLYLAHDSIILTGQDGVPLSDVIERVEISDVPETATQGTLTEEQLDTLLTDESAYIMFNHEKFYLMDAGHTEGFLTYSHVGVDSNVIHTKTFTITVSTRGWVLTDVEHSANA